VGYPRTVVDAAARSHTVDAIRDFEYGSDNVIGDADADRVQDGGSGLDADVPGIEWVHTCDVNPVGYRTPNSLGWLARRGDEQNACPVDKGNR
jgi:hypothetical protein